uniref:Uncharacterized protein n=1 Tax=Steinernema glaseri TaxID=37863 RepID=A0A1I8AJC9_9BILA
MFGLLIKLQEPSPLLGRYNFFCRSYRTLKMILRGLISRPKPSAQCNLSDTLPYPRSDADQILPSVDVRFERTIRRTLGSVVELEESTMSSAEHKQTRRKPV